MEKQNFTFNILLSVCTCLGSAVFSCLIFSTDCWFSEATSSALESGLCFLLAWKKESNVIDKQKTRCKKPPHKNKCGYTLKHGRQHLQFLYIWNELVINQNKVL